MWEANHIRELDLRTQLLVSVPESTCQQYYGPRGQGWGKDEVDFVIRRLNPERIMINFLFNQKFHTVQSRFLAISVPIAICLMLLLFSLFEFQTYRAEHDALHEKARGIAESQSNVLAESLRNMDGSGFRGQYT